VIAALVALCALAPALAGTSPKCSLCRGAIQGEYRAYDSLDLDVCAACMQAPECRGCGLPLAGSLKGDGEHCTRCLRDADRCSACGLPLLERYWTVVGAGGKFCEACREASPCSVCGAPVRDGRGHDGRLFCRSCSHRLLRDREAYDGVYERLVARARDVLGLRIARVPELVVESSASLESRTKAGQEPDRVCGLYTRGPGGQATIHVLSHLPETRATAVLAHELAHAWQAENCPDAQGLRVREGFAEWVAWRLLEGVDGCGPERDVIAARTDEYGLGFRFFTTLEERNGASHAIWYATAARSSP
jgi:hypothetical protein